jgi:hypothetical protein
MNKKIILGVMLICLLAFVAVMAFSQSSPYVRWEYTILYSETLTREQFIASANALGWQGWELVTSANIARDIGGTLVFKRRLP